MILVPFLLTVIFSYFENKKITSPAFYLKEIKIFFIKSFTQYRLHLFSILSNTHMVEIGYPSGIFSPIFVAEDFSGLFFLIKDPRSAKIILQRIFLQLSFF